MFAVIGLTFEDISSGCLPQVRLAEALESCAKTGRCSRQTSEDVTVYAPRATASQALITRTKYKAHGEFRLFLYFSGAAVRLCQQFGIPLRILEQVADTDLPADKETIIG